MLCPHAPPLLHTLTKWVLHMTVTDEPLHLR
jgi:hypothetical protein